MELAFRVSLEALPPWPKPLAGRHRSETRWSLMPVPGACPTERCCAHRVFPYGVLPAPLTLETCLSSECCVREAVIGEFGLDSLKRQLALLRIEFSAKDTHADAVAQLVAMQRGKRERFARSLKPRLRARETLRYFGFGCYLSAVFASLRLS